MSLLSVGPYRIHVQLARGGMGSVWRGEHQPSATPLAFKVIDEDLASSDVFRAAFRREVRAVAALRHPSVIRVYDLGEAPDGLEGWAAGSPYLVMELLTGGTLRTKLGRLPWPALTGVLTELLEALAHAHARGVLHRDIKPANVLLDGSGRIRLTDFGLAHALDRDEAPLQGGTPAYMPPEQLAQAWRDYGPWTDLYALGCVAWELVADNRGFAQPERRGNPAAFMYARTPVPEGFADWIAGLLAWRPSDRFACAADALLALDELGAPVPASPASPLPPRAPAETVPLPGAAATSAWSEFETATRALEAPEAGFGNGTEVNCDRAETEGGERFVGSDRLRDPAMPLDWRNEDTQPAGPAGVGLGLYGLRAPSLVGRVAERDRLWAALLAVHRSRQPQVVVLSGPTGCGKTRLAQWLAQRAQEVGAAAVLRANHGPEGGIHHGLGAMLRRDLGLQGLDDRGQRRRLVRLKDNLSADEADELVGVAALAGCGHRDGKLTDQERLLMLGQFLVRRARRRPVILWLEDVQWGDDALRFARHLATRWPVDAPVMLLLTARDDALEGAPRVALERLLTLPSSVHLQLGPLDLGERAALLGELLGLEEDLADQVEQRAGGNPLFAVQLMQDWVERGVLVAGSGGFRLREGATVEVPNSLHQLLSARLEAFLRSRPEATREQLELAAALGPEVPTEAWARACTLAGVPLEIDLIGALIAHALGECPEPGSWRFSQGLVRETLVRDARRTGRWTSHNVVCAKLFEGRNAWVERLGHHLAEAGRHSEAAEQLTRACEIANRGEAERAHGLACRAEEQARLAGIGTSDPRWCGILLQQGRTSMLRDDPRSHTFTARTLAAARACGDRGVLGAALREHGQAQLDRGELGQAHALLTEAAPMLREVGDDALFPCLLSMVRAELLRGDTAAARVWHEECEQLALRLGRRVNITRNSADLARATGDLEQAAEAYQSAADYHGRNREVAGQMVCLEGLAEVERLAGNLDEARLGYERVLELRRRLQGPEAGEVTELNLGLCHLEAGDLVAATRTLERLVLRFEDGGRRGLLACALLLRAECAAVRGQAPDWDGDFERAAALLEEVQLVDVDLLRSAQRMAAAWSGHGDEVRAGCALEFAAGQRARLPFES